MRPGSHNGTVAFQKRNRELGTEACFLAMRCLLLYYDTIRRLLPDAGTFMLDFPTSKLRNKFLKLSTVFNIIFPLFLLFIILVVLLFDIFQLIVKSRVKLA